MKKTTILLLALAVAMILMVGGCASVGTEAESGQTTLYQWRAKYRNAHYSVYNCEAALPGHYVHWWSEGKEGDEYGALFRGYHHQSVMVAPVSKVTFSDPVKRTPFEQMSDPDLGKQWFLMSRGNQLLPTANGYVLASWTQPALEPLRALLTERGVSKDDWEKIDANEVAVGMDLLRLFASLGIAHDLSVTTTANGTRTQHVYDEFDQFVYTSNGRVVATELTSGYLKQRYIWRKAKECGLVRLY